MSVNIAIDGPAGAGKSTIAKAVAKELENDNTNAGSSEKHRCYECKRS